MNGCCFSLGPLLAVLLLASATGARGQVPCSPPIVAAALAEHGAGDAVALQWPAVEGAQGYRLWAQWRVPEGEALHTHEMSVSSPVARLPPSPARWRPLKVSIEIQTVCERSTQSAPAHLQQLQFDPAAEAACPPVEGLAFDATALRLTWRGSVHERFLISFHQAADGLLLSRAETIGPAIHVSSSVVLPVVIRAQRACGEVQRSRTTFLLLR